MVSRTELTEHLYDQISIATYIEVFVGRLRKKLGSDLIETARGLGYRLRPPGMRRNSLAFRLVASAAVWCALWLSAGGYALSALFGNTVERNFDAHLGVLLEGLVARRAEREVGWSSLQLGEPRFEQPLSGWYWQIADRGRVLRRSSSLGRAAAGFSGAWRN